MPNDDHLPHFSWFSSSFRSFLRFPVVPGDSLNRAFDVELQDEGVGGPGPAKTYSGRTDHRFRHSWPAVSKNPNHVLPIQYSSLSQFSALEEWASSMKQ